METGVRVRIKTGQYKEKTGKVIGAVPMRHFQNAPEGQDITNEREVTLWVVQLKDGSQTTKEEKDLEVIQD